MLGGGDPVGVDRLDVVGVAPRRASGAGSARRSSSPSSIVGLRDPRLRRCPRADCATNDSAITDARARSMRACSSEMSSSWPKPHSGASIASAACTSTRGSPERTSSGCGSAGGSPGSNVPSTSRPQTFSNGHVRRRGPRCRRRGSAARRPPCRARRSRWRRRRRLQGRTGPRSVVTAGSGGRTAGAATAYPAAVRGPGPAPRRAARSATPCRRRHDRRRNRRRPDVPTRERARRPRARGEITARELVEASLSRIDALNPTYNAFIDVFHDEALLAADAIRPGDDRPLAGVPIAIKNNRPVEGKRLTFGVVVLRRLRAAASSGSA